MNHTEIASKTAAYLNTFLEKEGFLLLKTEYVKEDGIYYLRAYIDLTDKEREERKLKQESEITEAKDKDPGEAEVAESRPEETAGPEGISEEGPIEPGVGINDCALVSRRLSKWLDKEDFIPEEYMLEVCSKGYLN